MVASCHESQCAIFHATMYVQMIEYVTSSWTMTVQWLIAEHLVYLVAHTHFKINGSQKHNHRLREGTRYPYPIPVKCLNDYKKETVSIYWYNIYIHGECMFGKPENITLYFISGENWITEGTQLQWYPTGTPTNGSLANKQIWIAFGSVFSKIPIFKNPSRGGGGVLVGPWTKLPLLYHRGGTIQTASTKTWIPFKI